MKRFLITGGSGFIGSHLAERLLQSGARVTVLDDLSTGRWSNISHLEGMPGFRVLIASAVDRALVYEEVRQHDFVYHLASAVGVKLIMEEPVKTIDTIFHATDVVLSACSRYRVPVVITSTSEVYGKSTAIPFSEVDDVVMGSSEKRRWAYACAKALDEFLVFAHHYETQLPVYVARLFNTVGPRQTGQYGMVLPTFVRQALSNEPITVFGDGEQRRCFCSVHDVVTGLVSLPNSPGAIGKVINLGSEEEISIEGLAKKVISLSDSQSEIVKIPYEEAYGDGFDDMRRRIPDLTRAQKILGWSPSRSLDGIVRELIAESSGGS